MKKFKCSHDSLENIKYSSKLINKNLMLPGLDLIPKNSVIFRGLIENNCVL